MRSSLDAIRAPFVRRLNTPRWWSLIAFGANRVALLLVLAAVPAALAVAIVLAGGPLARTIVDPERVRDIFSRVVPGLITAATLSVGFAALSLRRGIKGIGELREHAKEDERYREEVQAMLRRARMPVGVPEFLATMLDDISRAAERALASAGAARDVEHDGARLGDALALIRDNARGAARLVRQRRADPDAALAAAMNLELEMTLHLTRAFAGDARVPEPARRELGALSDALRAQAVGQSYLRALATQWGLSRMVQVIVVTSFVGIVAAMFIALGYGQDVPLAWGDAVAGGVLAAGLFLITLPVAAFASYTLRFVFLNEHSLPLGEFILGPENAAVAGARHEHRPGAKGPDA